MTQTSPAVSLQQEFQGPVTEVDHPLVRCHLTQLRDETTTVSEFRRLVHRLSMLLAYEATKKLPTKPHRVNTPIQPHEGTELSARIGLVPILRAGLGMVDPVLELIPSAEVWHLGLYRDEETARPVSYYNKLEDNDPVDIALVLDPMLATGGSATAALAAVEKWGVEHACLLSIIAAPEGIRQVREDHPATDIFVCAVDERLNDQKFIVPGLGDAGDRMFGTLPQG